MVFCNTDFSLSKTNYKVVTILILVDGFLQCKRESVNPNFGSSHNPYFSRWFSAISMTSK